MKNELAAIYNTLKQLEMPPTPENVKHLAGIYIKLEELYKRAEEQENGGD